MPGPTRLVLPVPFPLETVNAWYFPGSEPALVDCGIGTSRSYAELLEGLRSAGANLPEPAGGRASSTSGPEPGTPDGAPFRLFLTHGHVDHAGNAKRLRDDWGVTLHAHPGESPFVETFRRDQETRNDEFAAALRAHGVPAEDVARIRADSDAIDRFLDDTPIDGHLTAGERVVLGELDAQVLHTPGHTPGSMSYLLTEDNQLLSGDTLLERITSNAVELRDADRGRFHQYVETIASLRRYVGVECLPGHHAPFALTDEVLDRHLMFHEERRQRILDALDRPRSGHELFPRVFPGLTGDAALFMGMAEIVGHLHSMELDGLIAVGDQDGVRRYRRQT